jgi:hypothetical protein
MTIESRLWRRQSALNCGIDEVRERGHEFDRNGSVYELCGRESAVFTFSQQQYLSARERSSPFGSTDIGLASREGAWPRRQLEE